jgi:hypothetical protein
MRLALAAPLKPLQNPKPITPLKLEEADTVQFAALEGHTGNLDIVVALEGATGTEPAPYAALSRTLELAPGEPVFVRWAHVALPAYPAPNALPSDPLPSRQAEGLARLREILARDWDAETTRLELVNGRLIEIATGEPDWDAALALAQTEALRSLVGPTAHLPYPASVLARHPDRGYSLKGDGSDHPWQWNGQSPAEAYLQAQTLIHAAPDLAKGLLRNYLAVQEDDGFIDWKPGPAGQRNRALCLPLLASLAWRVYEHTDDAKFLAEVYPGLRRFAEAWFQPRYDRDEDGLPEWSHTLQTGFDDNPTFVLWQAWAQGADITQAESPDLAAYLIRETRTLQKIAQTLGEPADPLLAGRLLTLQHALQNMWRDDTASYHYVDREAHVTPLGETLLTGEGDVTWMGPRAFAAPARLLVKLIGPREAPRPEVEITLTGRNPHGKAIEETLRRTGGQWYFGVGTASSERLYAELEHLEVRGLPPDFRVTVATVDLTRQDLTLLFPLWAGAPDPARAEALIRRTVLDPERYWRPYGLPACSAQDPAYAEACGRVWGFGNVLVAEGLVDYGYRAEAALLFTRLMTGLLTPLKAEQTFRAAHHPERAEGLGERLHLGGIAPVGLLLDILGVRIISPRKVCVEGGHPFPWPVTIKQRGVTVLKAANGATITFPTGQKVTLADQQPHVVVVE